MNKKFLAVLVMGLMMASTLAFAVTPAADNGLNKGKSTVKHLYLFEKNPSDWTIVEDGAWGKMTFKPDNFVFNGHGLEAGSEYTLIYYPDPWPGNGLMCLGSDVASADGQVHIAEDFDFTAIPVEGDENDGAKIWLVLSNDVDCEDGTSMTGWNPTEYLFEYALV